jgi:predicted nuclease with RNAse H fold
MIAGIDYGSKLAGTTVIAWEKKGMLHFQMSRKNQDADAMIKTWAEHHQPSLIMLDAPLSLPGVYRGLEGFSDYFYRKADQQLKAMSPMFLGGLTARAMKISHELSQWKVDVRECYPREVSRVEGLRGVYAKAKKEPAEAYISLLLEQFHLKLEENEPLTWHHADALLAYLSARRLISGDVQVFGHEEEGQIWV